MQKLASLIWKNNSDSFEEVVADSFNNGFVAVGKKKPYFAVDPKILRMPMPVDGSIYYIDGNVSSTRAVLICKNLLAAFGYKDSDFSVKIQE